MRLIHLLGGWSTLVDDGDFESLNRFVWRLYINRKKSGAVKFYVIRAVGTYTSGTYRTILMHRQILGLENVSIPRIDHIDDNGLNNLRENLRVCTNAQNMANRGKQRNNTSGFKGVYFHNNGHARCWQARVGGSKATWVYGGYFATPEEAARKYDELALQVYGPFAKLNFPQS